MANFLNEHIIMKALARVCRATSRPLTCGYFQVDTDLEDSGSARAQDAAQFFQALVAVLLWYVVRFCVVVGLCMFVESGVGVVCFYGEARVTICWTQGVFIATTLCPLQSHARKVLCWITCCCLRCAVRRATLFLAFSILGNVFPLTTDHLHVLSDDWPFGSK